VTLHESAPDLLYYKEKSELITEEGFTQVRIPADGNCLFNSISMAVE
jgi:hypothetical protein